MGATNLVIGTVDSFKVGAYGAAEGDAVDVGLTDGGLEVEYTSEEHEVYVDQHLGPVEAVTIKENMVLKINVAESSLANMAMACGYPTTAVADGVFTFGDKSEIRDYKVVYANVKGPGPGTRKFTIFRSKVKAVMAQKYMKDDLAFVPVEITVLADTTKSAAQRFGTVADVGTDTTAPLVALSTPVDGGTVTKDAKGTVVWTITEAGAMDEGSIVYGDTFSIINTTTPESAALVAGAIVYNAAAKTVTFTPSENWTASDTFQAIVTTGLKDAAGNRLAATKIEQFSVTA